MKVAIFSAKPYDQEHLNPANQGQHELTYFEAHLNPQTAILAKGFDAVCCFVNDTLNAETVRTLGEAGVRMIAMRCAGYNNVDLEAARKFGIRVARVPEYSPYAVAEHAVALILDLNRNIHRAYNRVRENDYSLSGLLGFDLHGKTVGVVGTGKIGVAFARIMSGFGCQVLASDPVENPDLQGFARYVDQELLLREADIISLHCPLLPQTHHLINAETIQMMKPGVMIINTSRGGLIDTPAVIDGLKSEQIGYLGLDVYEEEAELFFEDYSNVLLQDDVFARLLTFPNVVVTGHQAFFTQEALSAIAEITINNLCAFEQSESEGVEWVV
ncbi:2-hydroxyacid dehydrogenase [Hahella ganghwensis]|uniref:2-hydroxyacid dehydrogenase n=1 Tax=Hahella ganghwensis TaxID=286420 RepID=UPI0003606050|nr:2-hydroxyacid dehydrogenase [Hahella ganghwensis]